MADPKTPGVHESLIAMQGMANYLKLNPAPPRVVDASGKVLDADGTEGFSAAVIPYLDALNLKQQAKVQSDRLDVLKDPKTGLYGKGGEYYDQNLTLFSTGWGEKRFRFGADGALKVKWK